MMGRSRTWGIPVAAMVLAMMTGCAVNSTFVYKPAGPVTGVQKFPVNVAVLPFKDGTEDFKDRGSVFSGGQYNMAKVGYTTFMTALTPELWAKSFAEDLAVSGSFRSARFLYSPSELADEDFSVEGTVTKAYFGKRFEDGNEFAVSLRALAKSDKRVVWEKEISRAWKITSETIYEGCGKMSVQCPVDRHHADTNRVMREMFAEARADMVATLGSGPAAASPGEARQEKGTSAPPAQESVEQTIERLLKEK